jgi:formate-dependent nitrite reductase membrane component NrfD
MGVGGVKHAVIPLEARAASGAAIRAPREQGVGAGGSALMMGGRVAGQMVQTAYNAQHKIPWHWQVPAYLVTKAIGSGAFMLLALVAGLGLAPLTPLYTAAALFVALLFTGLTTALLVFDLEKPRLFLTILTRPQWRSWLTRGAFALIAFSAAAGLWLLAEAGALLGALPEAASAALRPPLAWLGLPLAALAAFYTAFLFAQAEGRDLWQSPLLPAHLLVQALVAGAAALLAIAPALPPPAGMAGPLRWAFGIGLLLNLFMTVAGELGVPHASEAAARAARAITHGRYRRHFWLGAVLLGHVTPLALLLVTLLLPAVAGAALASAGVAAIAGLYAYEHAFVMAPQEVPNS